jgi:hypothetical protein
MKANKIIFILIIGLIAYAKSFSQSNHKEFSEWKELKDFHEVIAHTFHPMEEGNFKPIRERSGELYKAAQNLTASKIPADLNTTEVKNAVRKLNNETAELDRIIKDKATDEQVKTSLTAVHETFHKIVGLCSKDEHEEHEHSDK